MNGTLRLLLGYISACVSFGQLHADYRVAHKITSPEPIGARFGEALAVVGDTLAIGAQNAVVGNHVPGAVYLFDKNGSFRSKIEPPAPESEVVFGSWITAVGDDRIAVSSDRLPGLDGQVHLYNVEGDLLRTFDSPSPKGFFGWSVASANNKLAISAEFANDNDGAVYIYDLSTDTPPVAITGTPGIDQYLGRMVEFLGDGQLLIASAEKDLAGAVYSYDLKGNLLDEIRPPHANFNANFGFDLNYHNGTIAIGAFGDNEVGTPSGAAYLYDSGGNELVKIFDPHPESGNWFGRVIEPVGDDRYLVSSFFDNTNGSLSGRVYLFDKSGRLLHAFESPEPGASHHFGVSLAVDNETIYIGENFNDGGFPGGKGAVWMFVPVDPGDFNADGLIDTLDINLLCRRIASGSDEKLFDLTDDDLVNRLDLTRFLAISKSLPGDTDLSGTVEFSDFLKLSSGFDRAGHWTNGDFDCTGTVDFSDFFDPFRELRTNEPGGRVGSRADF